MAKNEHELSNTERKIYNHFLQNIGKPIHTQEIIQISEVTDGMRCFRSMRDETGLDIPYDRKTGTYTLKSLSVKREPRHRDPVSESMRFRILHRDHSTCQVCGRTVSDGVKLVVDHKLPVHLGGKTEPDNLWTLCEACNHGKQSEFDNQDEEAIREIIKLPSGIKRAQAIFEFRPNVTLDINELTAIIKTRDVDRTIRTLREDKYGMKIEHVNPSPEYPHGGYVYHKAA